MLKKLLLSNVFFFLTLNIVVAQQNRWSKLDKTQHNVSLAYDIPNTYKVFELDEQALLNDLQNTPDWRVVSAKQSQVIISIPDENGNPTRFSISEASNMVPDLQAAYPNIRAYVGQGIDNPSATLRLSYAPTEGFEGMILNNSTKTLFFAKGENNKYALYQRTTNENLLHCTTPEIQTINTPSTTARDANSGVLNIFRLAMTCNGEYGTWAGGTVNTVLAKFNATMTRVNGVYEKELAIHMNMINNTNLIYFNASTDPYTGLDNAQIQSNITAVAGEANYDIGHLVGQGGSGGNAGCIGCVCVNNQKGSGYTSKTVPEGDSFDIDYVAHEMGHQFGGNHTWTSVSSNGTSIPYNENAGASLEPGSGSTIMAYAGITGSNAAGISTDVQGNSDAYFHFYSIQQITNYIATTSCQTTQTLTQATPTANAGADYTIPKNTPFVLTGSGTSDGTTTYCWEENDLGGYSQETTLPTPTSTAGPSFRSFTPTTSPKRYFPQFESVFNGATHNGAIGTKWDLLNTVGRTYKFKLTVRDNIAGGGQNASDASNVTVNGSAGPFAVTSQNTAETWATGETKTISWNVAGTTANGINTANVAIYLVDNTGNTLATLLATTPNDGSASITVPNVTSSTAKVMVKAIGNVFYALNSAVLGINTSSTCTGLCASSGSTQFADGVTFVGFNTISQASTGVADYTDNTAINTHVTVGSNYTITVNVNTDGSYTEEVAVWIDWNRDCTFNTSDEQYLLGTANNVTNGPTSNSPLTITVPNTAQLGETTMRVTASYIGNDNNGNPITLAASCDTGFWGEVEDYTVVIDAAAAVNEQAFDIFAINPNPSEGNFNIELQSDSNSDVKVQVYDVRGRLIFDNTFDKTQQLFRQAIDLSSVKAGVYLVNVSDDSHFNSKQLIVK